MLKNGGSYDDLRAEKKKASPKAAATAKILLPRSDGHSTGADPENAELLTLVQAAPGLYELGDRVVMEFADNCAQSAYPARAPELFAGVVTHAHSEHIFEVTFDDGDVCTVDFHKHKHYREGSQGGDGQLKLATQCCHICRDPFGRMAADAIVYPLDCGHGFCAGCLEMVRFSIHFRLFSDYFATVLRLILVYFDTQAVAMTNRSSCPFCRRGFPSLSTCHR